MYAPLKRSMNLRETASFDNDSIYGGFKLFGGLGYQIQLFSVLVDLLQFKVGTMTQMGWLNPELISKELLNSEDFYGEVLVFSSLRFFDAIELRLGGALNFEALETFDLYQTAFYISIIILYAY